MEKTAGTKILEIFEKGPAGRRLLCATAEDLSKTGAQIVFCYQAPAKRMPKISAG